MPKNLAMRAQLLSLQPDIGQPGTDAAEQTPGIPDYLHDTYWWAYLHPRGVRIFERQWLVNLILWGNFTRLRDAALAALGQPLTGRTLQVACVYGDFTPCLAQRLAPDARLDVVDVAPIQLHNLRRKLDDDPRVRMHCQNAADLQFDAASFDRVMVFFLLHEVPAAVRRDILAEVLRVLRPGGRAVLVDYHRPRPGNPLRYLMYPVLRTLEPFALDLWRGELLDWAPPQHAPRQVEKTTRFGGLYQQVILDR